ncbi:MAG: TROVE domain-containing protein [Thermoguttaceae bacterium]
MNYAKHVSSRQTPASEPIPGTNQVANHGGGYSFTVDCWGQLHRFLILGSEGGTYYVGERKLTIDNANCVLTCGNADPDRAVATVASVSLAGRAPKNDSAIFALALLASRGNDRCRRLALDALSNVCRIPTHLFQFISFCKEMRGWGRGIREAVSRWYNEKPVDKLAYQTTKYRNRAGYTHRDALRLAHPKTDNAARNALYRYLTKGIAADDPTTTDESLAIVRGFEQISALTEKDVKAAVKLIETYKMSWEHIPTPLLNSVEVWETLLPHMPPTALVRNLGKMTSIGLLKPMSAATKLVVAHLTDKAQLKAARVHPLAILLAQNTYGQGHGIKGGLTWSPVSNITAALEDAFHAAFDAVEPTGKNHLLCLDVSGSMGWSFLANTGLNARTASACMAIVTAKTEPWTQTLGFSHTLLPLNIDKNTSLREAENIIERMNCGSTNCSLPMQYALQNKLEVDAFIVYTDSETNTGDIHPCQALRQYNKAMSRNAKLIVAAMTATNITIADPNDANMLDVVGFDASCPAVMSDFVRS